MELYSQVSSAMSKLMTERYSSSFSSASRMFAPAIRPHIYNIYGLVRLGDEIVDTYTGTDKLALLNDLERETLAAIERGYSTNPVVHAYQDTARQFGIDKELIEPFFESMRTDLTATTHDQSSYARYIYGSAEVVGLMCLAIFCGGKNETYEQLRVGASHLGAAYQKINFLRDMAEDYNELGRIYFPGLQFSTMSDQDKDAVVADIEADLAVARPAIDQLPAHARLAVTISYNYYSTLLEKLALTPIEEIRQRRLRLSKPQKIALFAMTTLRGRR